MARPEYRSKRKSKQAQSSEHDKQDSRGPFPIKAKQHRANQVWFGLDVMLEITVMQSIREYWHRGFRN